MVRRLGGCARPHAGREESPCLKSSITFASKLVEVDGAHHAGRSAADARRDAALAAQGLWVLRLPASLVVRELPGALRLVVRELSRRKARHKTRTPRSVAAPRRRADSLSLANPIR